MNMSGVAGLIIKEISAWAKYHLSSDWMDRNLLERVKEYYPV